MPRNQPFNPEACCYMAKVWQKWNDAENRTSKNLLPMVASATESITRC